jgi:hypothetical protein
MESTMCLELEATAQEDRLAFLALPAKHASAQITGTTNDLFKAAQAILNQIVADMCGRRTTQEFEQARNEYYTQYVMVMLAVGRLISAVVPTKVIDRLSWESLSELEAEFRDGGIAAFGKDISDQALFTVWTLRKIHDVVTRLQESKGAIEKADQKLAKDFVDHILYSRFHLDCLMMSLRSDRAIYPEVLECISEGLRSLVNAYAYIRQVSDAGQATAIEAPILIEFDDEERELVALSMEDLAADASL